MMLTDFKGSQFSDDDQKDGLRSTSLLAILPPDVAASVRNFIQHSSFIKSASTAQMQTKT
jgi:hypothetical protein